MGGAGGRRLHFSVSDLLIAALAKEIVALIWSANSDFASMKSLGFVQLYA